MVLIIFSGDVEAKIIDREVDGSGIANKLVFEDAKAKPFYFKAKIFGHIRDQHFTFGVIGKAYLVMDNGCIILAERV